MTGSIWVFGYGSLIWRPDFPYGDARRACIEGWSRRFWQGSHDHRGTKTEPGRSVTIVETPGDRCYGRAFLVEPRWMDHLDDREKDGYDRTVVDIFFDEENVSGIVYIAPSTNSSFLGDAPLDEIAAQISRCSGRSGTNVEYLLELARALREFDISDPHVFDLESLVLSTRGDR